MTNEVEVAKMHAIADFFERNPELTVPFSLYEVRAYAMDKGELAKWAHAMPHPIDKGLTQNNKYYQLKARLTLGSQFPDISLPVEVFTSRDGVCEATVVGREVKEVTEYPPAVIVTKEVDIIEWKCTDSLLA